MTNDLSYLTNGDISGVVLAAITDDLARVDSISGLPRGLWVIRFTITAGPNGLCLKGYVAGGLI